MQREIVEYITISDVDVEDFDKSIANRLLKGWHIYGNPYSIADSGIDDNYYCQAMVKYKETECQK